jgi:hypothetical protein
MSLGSYTRQDFQFMAARRKVAFKAIAHRLGKNHAITKMMGSLAWGRHRFEEGAEGNLRTAIEDKAALDGAFSILNQWARDNDRDAQRIMLDLYPSSYESSLQSKKD